MIVQLRLGYVSHHRFPTQPRHGKKELTFQPGVPDERSREEFPTLVPDCKLLFSENYAHDVVGIEVDIP